ncbi:YIP1 family protein [Rheinheimera sp. 1928-s]|uniref:YIP1 family protein n=1 Tax=Rheinheimera sp. 1928-s TaxID=3033803 RepID=UPI0026342510|nr:YIP1 family protein [Rheinheimera sp. 1928-s]MDF3123514.1 YIP1 family protein [Rheinheimera sp. 1928-s]
MNLWTNIWFQPRQTIQEIIDTNAQYAVIPLAMLYGIWDVLTKASNKEMGDKYELSAILFGATVSGIICGLITLYVLGWLLKISGSWLGGKATAEHLRAAFAWGVIPAICTLPLCFVEIALYGNEIFSSETPAISANPIPFFVLLAIQFLLACWASVLMFMCIAQVQGFSFWKAIGNFLLAAVLFVAPFFVLAMILSGFRN